MADDIKYGVPLDIEGKHYSLIGYLVELFHDDNRRSEWGSIFLRYPGQPASRFITEIKYDSCMITERITPDMKHAPVLNVEADGYFNRVDYYITLEVNPEMYKTKFEDLLGNKFYYIN